MSNSQTQIRKHTFTNTHSENEDEAKTDKGKGLANIKYYIHAGCGMRVGKALFSLRAHSRVCPRMNAYAKGMYIYVNWFVNI